MGSIYFRDDGQYLTDFLDEVLVRCPKCGERALVQLLYMQNLRRVACSHCRHSLTQTDDNQSIHLGGPFDPYFCLPLWLQIHCCGETLWALNERHLTFLYRYVNATLRERQPNRNASLASRLPRWMTSRKNRNAVLHCLQRLHDTL